MCALLTKSCACASTSARRPAPCHLGVFLIHGTPQWGITVLADAVDVGLVIQEQLR
jgi:hypothetical protein